MLSKMLVISPSVRYSAKKVKLFQKSATYVGKILFSFLLLHIVLLSRSRTKPGKSKKNVIIVL